MSNKIIQNKHLRKFLKERDLFEQFLNNLQNRLKESSKSDIEQTLRHINKESNECINDAFIWMNTPEGDAFWTEVEGEFMEYMNGLEKEKETDFGGELDEL